MLGSGWKDWIQRVTERRRDEVRAVRDIARDEGDALVLPGEARRDAEPDPYADLPGKGFDVTVTREVYAERPTGALEMTVVHPPAREARPPAGHPCVVFFHGGGWRRGDPAQFLPFAKELAYRGFVAMSAQYRLLGDDEVVPLDAEEDARTAVAWARANASRLGLDASRVGAGGGSSGAHLALMTALQHGEAIEGSRPDLLLLMNPPLDFDDYAARVSMGERRAHSPLHLLDATLPPTLLLHGTEDKIIPYAQVVAFEARAGEVGVPALEIVPFLGSGHGFFNQGKGRPGDHQRAIGSMVRFLHRRRWPN